MSTPNFLLLISDQHPPDSLSINSDIPVRTPNIAKLASQGINFSKAICPSPMYVPSRACLASGKSYHRSGVSSNQFNYPLDQPTFYGILRDAGCHIAGVGKFNFHKPKFTWGLDGSHLLEEWGFSEGVDCEGKIDAQVGRYLQLLEARGELDNTIIIYTSDHGEMLGDHNLWMKGVPYQPAVGVPFVVYGPEVAKNIVREALVSLHDLAGTFLDYAGIDVPEDMDCLTLKPLLSGEQYKHRKIVFSALDDWELAFDSQYKYVRHEDGRELLFDLKEDPNEPVNLASEIQRLCLQLSEKIAEVIRRCPLI